MFEPHRGTLRLDSEMTKRVNAFVTLCKEEGHDILITETWRSKARQLYLWAKGRILPLRVEKAYLGYDDPAIYSKPRERRVTWTWNSKHITGHAIDIVFKVGEGITYSGDWDSVYDIAESVGLTSLYRKYGIDRPHLEFDPKWIPKDSKIKKEIKSLEQQYKIDAAIANKAVRKLNETTQRLALKKKVKYIGHKIVRG